MDYNTQIGGLQRALNGLRREMRVAGVRSVKIALGDEVTRSEDSYIEVIETYA